ncbi:hypothetical protein [Bacillus fonticola]|uniref:hypothetical protein n=1 Tax=Bacillus fonticola TaxID=2728853 RepID=UPI001475AE88|nr:hypothetical protein [Bacillus fonticola]
MDITVTLLEGDILTEEEKQEYMEIAKEHVFDKDDSTDNQLARVPVQPGGGNGTIISVYEDEITPSILEDIKNYYAGITATLGGAIGYSIKREAGLAWGTAVGAAIGGLVLDIDIVYSRNKVVEYYSDAAGKYLYQLVAENYSHSSRTSDFLEEVTLQGPLEMVNGCCLREYNG